MSKYIISSLIFFVITSTIFAQNDSIPQDSVSYQKKYGLRLGGDLGKLVRSLVEDSYSGFEVNGDYRLTENIYIAGEIGFEEKTTDSEFLNSTANGSYFRAGLDYNLYKNWFGLENMIYGGIRVGGATFSQTLNSYTIYNTDQSFPQPTISESIEYNGLTALWGELIIGIKAETLNNLYVGMNVQFKGRISETEPDNFENLFIPGFGRTYDSGRFGIGFGYNISYLIPLFKKEN